jgi:hypothetical protein
LRNVVKCKKYSLPKFENFVYFCIAIFACNTKVYKICKLCKAIYFPYFTKETFSYIAIGLSTEPIGCARTLYDIYSLLLVLYFYSFILFIFIRAPLKITFVSGPPD